MTAIRLKHVDRFTDRHGFMRYYFRRGRGARIALPGQPGSTEFMDAYQAALAGTEPPKAKKQRGDPGTFDRLLQEYFESSDFVRLKPNTRDRYRYVLERWISEEKIGHRPVTGIQREHIKKMIAKRAATPAAATDVLKKIKIIVRFAIDAGWREDDPTLRVKGFTGGEYHTWTDDQIAQYEAFWPEGSRERIAFSLLLYTGQRLSDVIRMSWRDIEDGVIQVCQQKTGNKVWIPVHPTLAAAISRAPKNHLAILTTRKGKPFTARVFTVWMAGKISAAKLPTECVTHGLRKAAARRLAEAGCTAHEIAAITGHKSLAEVERYTRDVDQKRLAKAAVLRLVERE